jgi:hypothetical protein
MNWPQISRITQITQIFLCRLVLPTEPFSQAERNDFQMTALVSEHQQSEGIPDGDGPASKTVLNLRNLRNLRPNNPIPNLAPVVNF